MMGKKTMTESKHTPPPWEIYKRFDGVLEIHGNERIVDGEEISDLIAENVSEDNAELITRAPNQQEIIDELLEALIWVESYTKDYPVESCGDEFKAWVEKARTAIARATQ